MFSWLLNWHLTIFLAPTFWEPEQSLLLSLHLKVEGEQQE
jgi:hypothetical protein